MDSKKKANRGATDRGQLNVTVVDSITTQMEKERQTKTGELISETVSFSGTASFEVFGGVNMATSVCLGNSM